MMSFVGLSCPPNWVNPVIYQLLYTYYRAQRLSTIRRDIKNIFTTTVTICLSHIKLYTKNITSKMKIVANFLLLVVSSHWSHRRLGHIVRHSIISKVEQSIVALNDLAAQCNETHHDQVVDHQTRSWPAIVHKMYMLQQYKREFLAFFCTSSNTTF